MKWLPMFRCSRTAPCSAAVALLRYQKAKIIRLYHGFFLQMYTLEWEKTIEKLCHFLLKLLHS